MRALRRRSAASASSAAGRSCSVCDQRVRGRGVGGLLAGGRLGELGGDALDGAPVALQVLLEVAPAGAHLAEVALGRLRGDARLALGRGRGLGGLARRGVPPLRPASTAASSRSLARARRRRASRRAARATRAAPAAARPARRWRDRSGRRPAGSTRRLG